MFNVNDWRHHAHGAYPNFCLVVGFFNTSWLFAQDEEFQKWLKQDQAAFKQFVEQEDREFAEFLKKDWQDF